MNKRARRAAGIALGIAVAVLVAPGCRAPAHRDLPPFEKPAGRPDEFVAGRILRVHAEHGYVVIQCASLPSAGEEATVYRDEEAVGRLRITEPIRMPYAVADIVEGMPVVGDRVKIARLKPAQSTGDGGVW